MLQTYHLTSFFLKFKSNLLVKRFFFLLNAAFAMAILDLISHVHLPSSVNMLPKCNLTSTVGEKEWPVSSSGCFTVGETGLMCPKTRLVMVAKRKIKTKLGIEQLLPVTRPSPTLHILAILRQQQNTIYRVMQNPFQTRC